MTTPPIPEETQADDDDQPEVDAEVIADLDPDADEGDDVRGGRPCTAT
jgi:hypothetical protein